MTASTTQSPTTETVRHTGRLTAADMRQTAPLYIDVPQGVTWLHVRFRYQQSRMHPHS